MQGDQIPGDHHVLRHAGADRLRTDEDDNPIGLFPTALALRGGEGYLSVQWVEHAQGTLDEQIAAAVHSLRRVRGLGARSAFAMANVAEIEKTCHQYSPVGPVRIAHEPDESNEAHAGIHNFPREIGLLHQILVSTAFTLRMIRNKDIP